MADKYNGIEKYMFSDAYTLFLKFKGMPDLQENWTLCTDEAAMYTKKYANHPLAVSLIMSVLEYLQLKICDNNIKGLTYEQWEEILKNSHKMGW